jgi:hypothetical protein
VCAGRADANRENTIRPQRLFHHSPEAFVGAEYLDGLCIHDSKVRMASVEHAQQPIKVGCGADGERQRYAF